MFILENNKYWLIAFIDDRTTTANTVEVLRKVFEEYSVPSAVVTDNRTEFAAVNSKIPQNHIFQDFGE